MIADDDTILSVQRLLDYLHCYDANDLVHLGQRYGFRIASGTHGYDYLTGGGGMIISLKLAQKMLQTRSCQCQRASDPDDMHLGMCMSNLGLWLVHSSRFHQARPEDYPEDALKIQPPISFHKFWNTDPLKIYQTWFKDADAPLKNFKYNSLNPHQEL